VENAIFHGIVPTGEEGAIHLIGRKIKDGVEIEIHDKGLGFEKDLLKQLQHTTHQDNSFVGIGLSHVYDSVRLYFAKDSCVEIESGHGGTMVKLILKSETRGEDHV
jgi:two-component system sensor histidine kinase YesM